MPGYEYSVLKLDFRPDKPRRTVAPRWISDERAKREKEAFWAPLRQRLDDEIREWAKQGWEIDGSYADAVHWDTRTKGGFSDNLIRAVIATINPVDWLLGERITTEVAEVQVRMRRAVTPTAVTLSSDPARPDKRGSSKFCLHCGSALPRGASFCMECGKKQPSVGESD